MRVTVLSSGSGGNATLVSAGGARVLVDAGVGASTIEARMQSALGEVVPLDAMIITHPHGDHACKASELAKRFECPVWMTEATQRRLPLPHARKRVFGFNTPFDIAGLRVEPMPVPHDAPNVALVFEHRGARAGMVTDLGHVPNKLAAHFEGCQLVLLEANHDPEMLAGGPYPDFLKKRVASRTGHLSNQQAAHLCARLGRETREIVLMHLSETNNTPMLALAQVRAAIGERRVKVRCAHQDAVLDLEVRASAQARTRSKGSQLALPFG
ncbi:MAG: MBL fold metallo-hydrolase [Sandaracinaceae bacterium]|nr:MBL fold metallo-hydrolase [Sandaracinaceae bacterium]